MLVWHHCEEHVPVLSPILQAAKEDIPIAIGEFYRTATISDCSDDHDNKLLAAIYVFKNLHGRIVKMVFCCTEHFHTYVYTNKSCYCPLPRRGALCTCSDHFVSYTLRQWLHDECVAETRADQSKDVFSNYQTRVSFFICGREVAKMRIYPYGHEDMDCGCNTFELYSGSLQGLTFMLLSYICPLPMDTDDETSGFESDATVQLNDETDDISDITPPPTPPIRDISDTE